MPFALQPLCRAAGLLAVLLSSLPVGPAHAEEDPSARQRRVGGDLFIAGGTVIAREPVGGDLFAVGGSVDVDAPVAGDVVASGGKLRLGADIGQSLYAAAGQLGVNGKVGRNARVAGGQVEFAPGSELAGNLSVAGGQVRLLGSVRGHVQAAAGRVFIDGAVGGDVLATTGRVALGPNARIAGALRYRSGEALVRDPAAQVAGGVEPLFGRERAAGASAPQEPPRRTGRGISWLWTAGLVVMAAVLLWVLPGFYQHVGRTLRERVGTSLLLGFVWLVCVPVAVLLLLITVIGIPLALLAAALYLALLPVGYVSAAIGAGDWALQIWRQASAAHAGWRIGAAALVLVLLSLVAAVPWLGGVVAFAALLAGLGALLLQLRRLAPGARSA